MTSYSKEVIDNVEFLGDRARQLTDQEIERARALDTKAAGIVAGSVALIAAGAGFAARFDDLEAGEGAKALWTVELGMALVFLLVAGALAVWAIAPKPYRTAIAFHELQRWVTPRILEEDPTKIRGMLLYADINAIGHARDVNGDKADRLTRAFFAFAAALACIVLLAISVSLRTVT